MTNYALRNTTVIFNAHRVQGWSSDEDALMVPEIAVATVEIGADGLVMAQDTGDLGGEVTLKLLATSLSTQYFMQQHELIKRGARVQWNGSIDYGGINTRVALRVGTMLTGPSGQTLGKTRAAPRQFVFHFQEINKNVDGGVFAAAPGLLATV